MPHRDDANEPLTPAQPDATEGDAGARVSRRRALAAGGLVVGGAIAWRPLDALARVGRRRTAGGLPSGRTVSILGGSTGPTGPTTGPTGPTGPGSPGGGVLPTEPGVPPTFECDCAAGEAVLAVRPHPHEPATIEVCVGGMPAPDLSVTLPYDWLSFDPSTGILTANPSIAEWLFHIVFKSLLGRGPSVTFIATNSAGSASCTIEIVAPLLAN